MRVRRSITSIAVLVAFGAAPSAAPAASAIRGTVTATATGAAVGTYPVELYDAGFAKLATTCTAADGSYSFAAVAPGGHYVRFAASAACPTRGYAPEWWDSFYTQAFAQEIVVVDGTDVTGIDATLNAGSEITGRVTNGDTGASLANVRVEVLDTLAHPVAQACTGADGRYTISELAPLPVTARFVSDGSCGAVDPYPTQYYLDSDTQAGADSINLGPGATAPDVDGHLRLRFVRTVTVSIAGTGIVTSTPAGINCPPTCAADFPKDSAVTLTAAAASGSAFSGWGFPCSGTGACVLTVDTDLSVAASFAAQTPPGGTPQPTGLPAARAARCRLAPAAKVKSGAVSVKIACDTSAKLTLSGSVRYKSGKRTKTLKLERVTATATARTVTLKLPAAARAAVRARKAVSASFTLVASNAGGDARTTARVKRLR